MSEITESNVIELGTNLEHTPLEYIYMTIPAEYVCVYHRILAMLADYGVEMLKDCKATCKDRNSGVIECFNMFNAAVAARKLGNGDENSPYTKEAATLIKYIKTKINQIYKGKDNSTSFVFPVDENGQLKAFVSCGERPKFWINPDDGELYEHKFDNGFDEHFRLGEEDKSPIDTVTDTPGIIRVGLGAVVNPIEIELIARYEKQGDHYVPCADIKVKYNGKYIDLNNVDYQLYFDGIPVIRFNDVQSLTPGIHEFGCVINYNDNTNIKTTILEYEDS